MRAILIVRLGALGDIIHALPMAAALRARFPEARMDWVVDERYRDVLNLVPILDRRIVLDDLPLTKSLVVAGGSVNFHVHLDILAVSFTGCRGKRGLDSLEHNFPIDLFLARQYIRHH